MIISHSGDLVSSVVWTWNMWSLGYLWDRDRLIRPATYKLLPVGFLPRPGVREQDGRDPSGLPDFFYGKLSTYLIVWIPKCCQKYVTGKMSRTSQYESDHPCISRTCISRLKRNFCSVCQHMNGFTNSPIRITKVFWKHYVWPNQQKLVKTSA